MSSAFAPASHRIVPGFPGRALLAVGGITANTTTSTTTTTTTTTGRGWVSVRE